MTTTHRVPRGGSVALAPLRRLTAVVVLVAWHLLLVLFVVVHLRSTEQTDATGAFVFGLSVLVFGAGTAIAGALNERELRHRSSNLEALHDFALALDHARHTHEVAGVLAESARDLAGLSGCLVLAHRAGTDSVLAAVGTSGVEPGSTVAIHPLSVVNEAWTEHDTVVVRRIDAHCDPALAHALPGASAVAVVPMFSDGLPAGALIACLSPTRTDRFTKHDIATVEQLTAHAALALRNAWLLHDVEELAVTDDLTRLANRRQLEVALTSELAKAKADGSSLGFVLVDLDRFKVLNDTHGHLTGDEVLRRVSDVLVGVTELGDTVARYGGEEFALVLPGRDPMATAAVAERARLAVAALAGPVPVTASFGACCFPADAADGSALIRAADEAMYESKRAGRNRVTSALGRANGWLDLPWRSVDLDAPAVR